MLCETGKKGLCWSAALLLSTIVGNPAAAGDRSSLNLIDSIPLAVEGYASTPPGLARGEPWDYQFPDDYGPHDDYRSELWQWYVQVSVADGSRLGIGGQMLRMAVAPPPDNPVGESAGALPVSAWSYHNVFVSVHAITNPAASNDAQFQHSKKLSREALALAGTSTTPMAVWNAQQSWSIEKADACTWSMTVTVTVEAQPLNLVLDSTRCPVRGTARALPSLFGYTQLIDRVGGKVAGHDIVSGRGWLDRAWGELPVGQGPVVVDQIRLALPDWSQLLLLRVRRRDGSGTETVSALRISSTDYSELEAGSVTLTDLGVWDSPASGARYSAGWKLLVAPDIALQITPVVAAQEIDFLGEQRWIGFVALSDADNVPVAGFGVANLSPISVTTTTETRQ